MDADPAPHKRRRRGGKRGGKKHAAPSDKAEDADASEAAVRSLKRPRGQKSDDSPQANKKGNSTMSTQKTSGFSESKSPVPSASPATSVAATSKAPQRGPGPAPGRTASATAHSSSSAPHSSSSSSSNAIDQKKKFLVARWQAREEVVGLNQQISTHAQRKQLSSAIAVFEQLLPPSGPGPNSHSWPAIVFAHVRCGDVSGAAARVEQMRSYPTAGGGNKAKQLKPCVVTYTTLLKGFCGGDWDGGGGGGGATEGEEDNGGLSAAWRVLAAMRKDRVAPNLRTVRVHVVLFAITHHTVLFTTRLETLLPLNRNMVLNNFCVFHCASIFYMCVSR